MRRLIGDRFGSFDWIDVARHAAVAVIQVAAQQMIGGVQMVVDFGGVVIPSETIPSVRPVVVRAA